MSDDKIEIYGEPTMDLQVCKFSVDQSLLENGMISCKDSENAKGSPLLEDLFAIDGVQQVMVFANTVTVAKTGEDTWQEIGKKVGDVIRAKLKSDQPLFAVEVNKRQPSEKQIHSAVSDLLEREINPQVASHGGRIDVVDVKDTTVYLSLSGGCQGCSSANATLKQGVERAIFEHVPLVSKVVDITDHASGMNPYV